MPKEVRSWLVATFYFVAVMTANSEIIERGPHTAVHRTVVIDPRTGQGQTNEWVQVQAGLNFLTDHKEFRPSSDSIELDASSGGARFLSGPFKVRFNADYKSPDGLEITMPDGKTLKIQTVGIALTDAGTGESVWLGELRNAQGFLVSSNEICYPNAFEGIQADILIKVGVGRLEHDITIKERPVDPRIVGLAPERCRLEVWHRIIEGVIPEATTARIRREDNSTDEDDQIDFGGMAIVQGTAFMIGDSKSPVARDVANGPPYLDGRIVVAKEVYRSGPGLPTFLIESVPYAEAMAHLGKLPARKQANYNQSPHKRRLEVASETSRVMPARWLEADGSNEAGAKPLQIASLSKRQISREPGFLIDYTAVVTASNMRFAGNTTYHVTGKVSLTGVTSIEGGAIIKYAPFTNNGPVITVMGPIKFETSPIAPAIFTAESDHSVGEMVGTNTPSGYYGWFLEFPLTNPNAIDLHDLRFCYGQYGVTLGGTNQNVLSNIQAVGCTYPILAAGATAYVRNYLAHECIFPLYAYNSTFHAEHVTAHTANKLFYSGAAGLLYITNSLAVGMTNASFGVTSVNSTNLASAVGVFESLGAGAHYLVAGSPYRNAGSTALSSNMLAILKQTTTDAPLALSGPINVSTTLSPQAQRDTDVPNLGYHYTPIDYLCGNLVIGENATLLLTNGVALGIHSASGAILDSGAKFISEGKPHIMNRLVRYQCVQEQPVVYGTVSNSMTLFGIDESPSIKPDIAARFTEVSVPADLAQRRSFCSATDSVGSIALRDCRLWNLYDIHDPLAGAPAFALTNNILQRCEFAFNRTTNLHQLTVELWNNLLNYGSLALHYTNNAGSPPTWKVHDNLFIGTNSIVTTGSGAYLQLSHNGYYLAAIPSLSLGDDKTPGGLDFQVGPLGPYYYPATNTPISTNLWTLVDAGSRSPGDATLYHSTTRVDQAKETSSVDIGFHFVAVDGDGIPIDGDGDGFPDYLEDGNGDGDSNNDATPWNGYTSPLGLSGATGLQTFTPLK